MAATAATTAAATGSSNASALLARLHPELYLSNHLAHSSRSSSSTSSPLTFPQVDLNLGPISSSSSSANRTAGIPSPSALVKYGSTTVICNITPSIVYPSAAESSSSSSSSSSRASSSSSSTIIPSISLTPLSSPSNDFKSGAPSNYAQATTERLFSFLDAAMPFEPSVLHIPTDLVAADDSAGKEAVQSGSSGSGGRVRAKWTLFADCVVIGFDGALLETCMLAIIAALRQVHLPKAVYSMDENVVIASPSAADYWSLKSKMTSLPLAFSMGIYKGTLLLTPSSFESDLLSSCIQLSLSYPNTAGSSTTLQQQKPVLSALHSTGPLSATNVKNTSAGGGTGTVGAAEDEDLIAVCVQMAAVKGAEIVRLMEGKEEELLKLARGA
ncbi:hypothetical protein BCV69DRAFT_311140 [Microstroma glucosiphilum]|uniref:Ribosomal RNA-processing protein 43 n=1 Tax=Pseudomicrostroma glucosiphilum TaxID=1684307 RepID=A0A316UBT9_9BASI|nr:hypothetical protein BCV69DRAFT_311140 [Pseudomicrostroma glucosiphilum]PWN22328.1 hypothetical protein BCV69DRAFT_311140 [Pseudomicrostroma glucosiphilum]